MPRAAARAASASASEPGSHLRHHPEPPEPDTEEGRPAPDPQPADGPRPESFPRSARLTRTREFDRVLASGFRVHGRHLVATLLSNSLPTSRLGLVISRKVGKAVIRNRVRRRLREIFRRRLRVEIDGVEPADLVVRALPSAGGVPQSALEQDLEEAAARWRRRCTRGRT